MDLANLMNSLSLNDRQPLTLPNFRLGAVEINNIHTDLVFAEFSNQCLIIITQYGKVGNALKVTKEQVTFNGLSTSEPVFSVQALSGADNIEQQAAARFIAEKLNSSKPLMFFLNLKDYKRETLLQIAERLPNFIHKRR